MPLFLGVPLRALNRVLGWVIARDCTCGMRTANDAFHKPGCPHPIVRRSKQPTEPFEPVSASITIITSQGKETRRRSTRG